MPVNNQKLIAIFLNASTFAVAGASQDRSKYGNKIFRAIADSGRNVYPLNPKASEVEGATAYTSILELPVVPESLSIVTPPHVTREIIQQAITAGVKNIWMQPGAEDANGSQSARKAGRNVIDDGSCLLVSLSLERSSNKGSKSMKLQPELNSSENSNDAKAKKCEQQAGPACPVCGGSLIDIRAKLQCTKCHRICETCCEGGRG